ncbi:hypothetical protein [Paludisphaera borealis]|uniref:Plasmid related protein n=1 Tax=Paludisphaera borealis TaxID=1387353 RepID=A0A1U7CZC6_9BACT|nr:hypothetical protein [Paludisphaera borealis]APW64294.1 hypothetical protein BSF38_20002 [Paludisphaera borealis]
MTPFTVVYLPLSAPPKFPLGAVVITSNAQARLTSVAVADGLRRHAMGDWGDICEEDAQLNEAGLIEGERLHSVYGAGEHLFWVITERDRSVTTVLMPEDY